MHIRSCSKRAYVLLESMIILMFISFIVTLALKVIQSNYLKSNNFYIYEETKSLTLVESELLYLTNDFINKNKEEYRKLINDGILEKKEKKIYSNSNYKNLSVVFNGKDYFIIEEKENGRRFIGLKETANQENIILTPNHYKTNYIVK
ncbi:hypothetical protein ACH36K_12410 [Clostridium sp. MB05]|uniref:hypothetical protein n=1 Tax=Clostridium sp. MB05 TaxID=3376682 RepID=UPI0039822561